MKNKLIAILTLTMSYNISASNIKIIETEKCKSKAISSVYYDYQKRSGTDAIDIKVKEKSALSNDTLYHFIEIIEYDTHLKSNITVGLDPNTCKIKIIQ